MAVEIPVTPGTACTIERVSLEGSIYTLRMVWSERLDAWLLDIMTNEGVPIAQGLPLRAGVPINNAVRHLPGMPPGLFVVYDSTQQGNDPTFDDLGVRVLLIYLTAAEAPR